MKALEDMKKIKEKNLNKIKYNNMHGITLIALVITIVILIILAGVAISLSLGENGIFNKTKQAKENYMMAVNEEQEGLVNVEVAIDEMTGEYVPYYNPYVPVGFTHIGTADWNSGYQIEEILTGNVFVWVPCVLDQAKVKVGDTVQTFKKTTTGKYNDLSLGLSPTDTSVTDVDPTNAIRTSVGTYGGFYIAAYEAGIEGTINNYNSNTKTATNGSVKPLSKAGKGVWNSITRADSLTVAASMVNTTDGVKSGLISGECWDTTLQWMVNSSTNEITNVGYDTDSTGKGLYGQSEISTTGYYAVNNIYDMAGNVWEWTTENGKNTDSSYLVLRGGGFDVSSLNFPAAYRKGYNGSTAYGIGFRVVLYK